LINPLPNDVTIQATFPGGITETRVEEIPSALTGTFIFNIGFGFSF